MKCRDNWKWGILVVRNPIWCVTKRRQKRGAVTTGVPQGMG